MCSIKFSFFIFTGLASRWALALHSCIYNLQYLSTYGKQLQGAATKLNCPMFSSCVFFAKESLCCHIFIAAPCMCLYELASVSDSMSLRY